MLWTFDMRVEDRMEHADAVIFKRDGMVLGIQLYRIQLDRPSDCLRCAGFNSTMIASIALSKTFSSDCFIASKYATSDAFFLRSRVFPSTPVIFW